MIFSRTQARVKTYSLTVSKGGRQIVFAASELKQLTRRLARAPMFTAVTLLTLAIGIGANTAMFSVVHGVLLKPLPYPHPERLVAIWETATGINLPEINASPATYFTFREENRTFEDTGLWRTDSVTVTGLGEPEQVDCLTVTDGTLPIVGIPPLRGRWFTRQDDSPGSPETAMLTWAYWQRRFGGDPAVIGRRILVDGRAREVIGIMPAHFRFMNRSAGIILPFQFDRGKVFIGNFSYQAIARLKPGVTLAEANADVARMLPLLARKFPPAPGMSIKMLESAHLGPSVRPLEHDVIGDVGRTLWVLMATVGLVLLIACANVANLLLVRAEARQHEFAIRAALGAGRGGIAREILFESVALGIIGGIAGCALAWAALRLLLFLAPANLPRLDEITLDTPVLLFASLLSVGAGALFGLVPIFKYAGARLQTGLQEEGRTSSGGRERHRARSALVVAQVALALVLLISSGLMIRTLLAMQHVSPGFTSPDQILTVRISIPDSQTPEAERVARMYQEMSARIAALPGVTAVGVSNSITMDGHDNNDPLIAEDRPFDEGKIPPLRRYKFISPGYFQAMGNAVLAGRDFTWEDIFEKRNVVLVSENLARELWGNPAAALGKRVRETPKSVWRQIIGVVGNERDNGVDQKAPTIAYWPLLVRDFWQFPVRVQRGAAFAVRSSRAGTAGFLKEVQRAVWSVNPDLPLADVRTVRQIYDHSMARTSFTLVMLAIAATMALILGLVGIYGVISYSVSQRTREIGIRIALGAEPGEVRGMFVRHGLLLTAIGAGCGLAVAYGVTRLMSALLFEVSPADPATYTVVAMFIIGAALLASYLPARRATAIAPAEALRIA